MISFKEKKKEKGDKLKHGTFYFGILESRIKNGLFLCFPLQFSKVKTDDTHE